MMIPWQVYCLIVAAVTNAALAFAVGLRLRTLAVGPMTAGLLMCGLWAGFYAVELQASTLELKVLVIQLRGLFMPFYLLVWYEAAYRFVNGRRALTGWKLAALLVVPLLTVVFNWLPDSDFFRYDYRIEHTGAIAVLRFSQGPWTRVLTLHNAILLILAIHTVKSSMRETPWEAPGRILVLVCAPICFVIDSLYFLEAPFFGGINYAPILMSVTSLGVAAALFRWRMVDLAPVARAALIENLEDAILVIEKTGRVVDLNQAAAQVLGERPNQIIGRSCHSLFKTWPLLDAWVEETNQGRAEFPHAGLVYETVLIPVSDARRKLQARLLILRDITRRKQVEEELQHAKEVAEAADQAKSRFLAMMSHEIRTPMNGVVGFAQLLQGTTLTNEQREYLDFIASSGRSLLVIIDDVLDYSKIAAGRLEIEETPCRPREIVERAVQLFQPRFGAKQLTLTWAAEPGVPTIVQSDPVRIEQVLSNLLGNALKFTDRGGVSIQMSAPPDVVNDGRITIAIEVTDTGIGIAPEVRERLFRPFGQADNSITRRYGGTGLGLVIAKRLCELMDGHLEVHSELGRGSRFTATVRPRIDSVTAARTSLKATEAPLAHSLRLLVFEDNPVNQHLIRVVLSKLGHRLKLVGSGAEGLALLQSESFDGILMDIEMPGMDGCEAVRRLRELEQGGRRHHVIAVTAHALQGERERCIAAGMDDYLAKPFTRESLQQALARCPQIGS